MPKKTKPAKVAAGIWKIDSRLFVANRFGASENPETLQHYLGITGVVNLAGAEYDDLFVDQGIAYCNLRVLDRVDAVLPITEALAFIQAHHMKQGDGAVLVHCRGAHSRSLAICTAWLMHAHNMPLATDLGHVKGGRALQHINAGFLKQLEAFDDTQPQTKDKDESFLQ